MKLFDLDWTDFIARLADWDRLSLKARKTFAGMKPNQGRAVTEFDGYVPEMAAAGLLAYYADGRRVKLYKECRPFARAVRAVLRNDVFGNPSEECLHRYLRDHFTAGERSALSPGSQRYYYGDETSLLRQVTSAAWLDGLAAASNGKSWKQRAGPGQSLPGHPDELKVMREVVEQFKTFSEQIAFRELPDRFAMLSADMLGTAILLGIQYLFLFPSMRPDDMTPVIGLWPTITQRLHRPKPGRPKRIEPDVSSRMTARRFVSSTYCLM